MYRNLNADALGITGRQSELIELALTYGFRGVDLDIEDVLKRVRTHGLDSARRYVASADLQVGELRLPVKWQAAEIAYRADLGQLREVAEIAAALGATCLTAAIRPSCVDIPFHENFELHRRRFGEIGEMLAPHDLRLGLALQSAPALRTGHDTPFVHDAETLLTLIRTVNSPQVGLTLDTWNWHVGGGSLDQLRQLAPPQIVAVRFADLPADADLQQIEEQERYLPGDGGAVDCAACLRLLAEMHFAGPLSLYPHPARFLGMTRDAIVQQAAARFDALFRAAGVSRTGQLEPLPAEPEQV
jgi:sugar phosphate isomerase/epimerase